MNNDNNITSASSSDLGCLKDKISTVFQPTGLHDIPSHPSADARTPLSAAAIGDDLFPSPGSWKGIKRVLIEYCAPEDSELCKDTPQSRGCLNVRCTKSHNMAKSSSLRSLLAFVQTIPPGVVVCLWSGIPCTGGSSLQSLNKHLPEHASAMKAHLRLWHRLFNNFVLVAQAVVQRGGHLVLEWPVTCRYWKHPKVKKLLARGPLTWQNMRVRACAHGQLIMTGKYAGKALTKAWRLSSTMAGLRAVMSLDCPGDHEHITTSGAFTLLSGKYPPLMAAAFHQHFSQVRLVKDSDYTACDLLCSLGISGLHGQV